MLLPQRALPAAAGSSPEHTTRVRRACGEGWQVAGCLEQDYGEKAAPKLSGLHSVKATSTLRNCSMPCAAAVLPTHLLAQSNILI